MAASFRIYKNALFFTALFASVNAQQAGTLTTETHPSLTWQTCSSGGSCTTNNGKVVLDANWRWVHDTSGSTNCYTGNTWDTTLCPDDVTCAANCALDGADYSGTYGVTSSGSSLKIGFVTGSNVGSRLYLMSDDSTYESFKLLNQEFTFDVDVSNLPCGLNGALYLVDMDTDGGLSDTNKAGAKYGTGYCDSQCPRDLKFIGGKANAEGWQASSNNANTGLGQSGSCCAEMDIWEANSMSTALTPHPCDTPGQTICDSTSCGGTYGGDRYGGTCDPDGCDFNPYRMGVTDFYGPGKTVDTSKPFTVVTQFITDDGTSSGTLSEIKRFYVQNGETIDNPESTVSGVSGNSITADYCSSEITAFGSNPSFTKHGGLAGISAGLADGMVLVLSLWDDYYADMLWLDSTYPTNDTTATPGAARGSCATSSGDPSSIESSAASASVTFSNIKVGPIGSTTGSTTTTGGGNPPVTSTPPTSGTPPSTGTGNGNGNTNCASHWGQCGGQGWTGATCCESGTTCQAQNAYYSQCL